jgi:5'-3' exonuclease
MLLDSASLWYRAYYGMPDTLLAPDGTPVNAIRGYLDMTARLIGMYSPSRASRGIGAPPGALIYFLITKQIAWKKMAKEKKNQIY